MPEDGRYARDRTFTTGVDYGNVVRDRIPMPYHGWVTDFRVSFGGDDGQLPAKLAIWEDGVQGNPLVYKSPEQLYPSGSDWRWATDVNIPMSQGYMFMGFWRDKDYPCIFHAKSDRGMNDQDFRVATYTGVRDVPPVLIDGDERDGLLSMVFYYARQYKPGKPDFIEPTPLHNGIGDLNLEVACTLPHPDDGDYDYTTWVQLYLWNYDENDVVFDQWVEVEEGATEFTYTLPEQLNPSDWYEISVRHMDSWGSRSDWRSRDFQASAGPDAPDWVAPEGRQIPPTAKPVEFRGTYTNPLGGAFSKVQIEIWNDRATTRLYQSGDQNSTQAVTLGGEWVVGNSWLSQTLTWGRAYWIRARTKDAAGNYGGWRWRYIFFNSAPRAPFNMKPSGGRTTPSRILQCDLSDPDGDPITSVEYRVYRKSTGALAASGTMEISPDGRKAAIDPGAAILADVAYKWDARASDGDPPSPSSYSAQQEFIWAPVPQIDLMLPDEGVAENDVEDPSFEYASSWWTHTGASGLTNTIGRHQDPEAFVGEWSLRGVVGDHTLSNPLSRSGFQQIDITRAYYFSARVMREALRPASATHLAIEAYNAGGTLLGTLYPGDFPNGTDPNNAWEEVEGWIGPSAQGFPMQFPVGTTQMRWKFEPSRGISSNARIDAVYRRRLSASITYAEAVQAKDWLGYFDGDTISRRGRAADYEWTILAGSSVSRGLQVLQYPNTVLNFHYSSPASSAKSAHRMYLEQWQATRWKRIYDTGWTGGAAISVNMPASLLRNQQLYRFKLEVRDSATTPRVGATEWVEFQTGYEGPEPLQILELVAMESSAALFMRWERTQMSQLQFGGYEVAVAPFGQQSDYTVLALISNPDITEFTFHEPVSGREYYLMVRQVENVQAEQVQGGWTRAYSRVDYRQWFLKDLQEPENIHLGFDVMAEDVVSVTYPKGATELLQWGETAPVFYPDTRNSGNGAVVVRIERDELLQNEKEVALRQLRDRRRFGAILMTTYPNAVYYVFIRDMVEEYSDMPWHSSWTVNFSEIAYERDYYLREGIQIAE